MRQSPVDGTGNIRLGTNLLVAVGRELNIFFWQRIRIGGKKVDMAQSSKVYEYIQ